MDTQALHLSADILLAAGLIMLILTVILSVRFNIIRILKLEFGTDNKAPAADSDNGAARTVSSTDEEIVTDSDISIGEDKVFEDAIAEEPSLAAEHDYAAEAPAKQNDISNSDTIVIAAEADEHDPSDTVIAPKKKRTDGKKADYRITENIIVIHGDPTAIS